MKMEKEIIKFPNKTVAGLNESIQMLAGCLEIINTNLETIYKRLTTNKEDNLTVDKQQSESSATTN